MEVPESIVQGIAAIVSEAKRQTVVHVNSALNMMYWQVGKYLVDELHYETYGQYGKSILQGIATRLTSMFGSGFTRTALVRMMNVAQVFSYDEMCATLSHTLTWSHLIDLATIDNQAKRLFYQKMCIEQHWSTRQLGRQLDAMLYERTLIAAKPEEEQIKVMDGMEKGELTPEMVLKSTYIVDFLGLHGYYSEKNLEDAILVQLERFILELGQGFAFLERQKRISVDAVDYFYHRGLNRLVAIDLKLGKFKPEYKGQMELYLKYLQAYEQKPHEESPIGLLLCSEGNTEQVELMMLGEDNIKVAQYLTELPDKQWFIDKLNRSILIAKENSANNK
ncbi:MAG: DUF1016 family protein [Bacteroidales bacterium]|nr:DUF1016 family protein [Bacteroidales bacterium]